MVGRRCEAPLVLPYILPSFKKTLVPDTALPDHNPSADVLESTRRTSGRTPPRHAEENEAVALFETE